MATRIAVIDNRIPDQAGWMTLLLDSDVVGASRTINIGHGDSQNAIVSRISSAISGVSGPIKLDLISHGSPGLLPGSTVNTFTLSLGSPGLYNHPASLGAWATLSGRLAKIRIYACGVESDLYGEAFSNPASRQTQHELMAGIASTTGAEVKYSLQTYSGDTWTRGTSEFHSPDRMSSSVFVVGSDGSRRQIR